MEIIQGPGQYWEGSFASRKHKKLSPEHMSFVHLYEGKNRILSSTLRILDLTVSLWGDRNTNQDPVTQQPHVPQQPLPDIFFFFFYFFFIFYIIKLW